MIIDYSIGLHKNYANTVLSPGGYVDNYSANVDGEVVITGDKTRLVRGINFDVNMNVNYEPFNTPVPC